MYPEVFFENHQIRWTHNPEIAFTISETALGSCQAVSDDKGYNLSLMGKIIHGKQKIMVVENKKTGAFQGVLTTKLIQDEKDRPVLLREPIYSCHGSQIAINYLQEFMTLALVLEAEKMGLPLIIGRTILNQLEPLEKIQSPLFQLSPFELNLMVNTGTARIEYEDIGKQQIKRDPLYPILKHYLIRVELKS